VPTWFWLRGLAVSKKLRHLGHRVLLAGKSKWFRVSKTRVAACPVSCLTLLFFGKNQGYPEAAETVTAGTSRLYGSMRLPSQPREFL
jgi:hypothetical protein